MDISYELPFGDGITEITGENSEILSEFSIIPREGLFLGLDISERSSGITVYNNGVKTKYNAKLETSKKAEFAEVKMRRELKSYLSEIVEGKTFDLIIIEDAFQGPDPVTTRELYAINTAIDELILDGVCQCKKFKRVNNKQWKSWLFKVDKDGMFKGLNDKERIKRCLELLGIIEDEKEEGFQDRLDSNGMLIGYFYEGYKVEEKKVNDVLISFKDIVFDFQESEEFILENARKERKCDDIEYELIDIGNQNWTRKRIVQLLREHPSKILISSKRSKMGVLGRDLGLDKTYEGVGYFAFWLNNNKWKLLNK